MSIFNLRNVLIGNVAIITMDVPGTTALKLGLVAFLPPRMTGRWFVSQGPPGTRLFLSSLVVHFFYEIGLWLGVSILRAA